MYRYKTSREEDDAVVADPRAGPREKVAARLLRIEKSILSGGMPSFYLAAAAVYTASADVMVGLDFACQTHLYFWLCQSLKIC